MAEKVTGGWFPIGGLAKQMLHGREAIVTPAQARAMFSDPVCPKNCDVATPPENPRLFVYVCSGCGTEFPWPPKGGV